VAAIEKFISIPLPTPFTSLICGKVKSNRFRRVDESDELSVEVDEYLRLFYASSYDPPYD
jgi:hypothetical protein